MEGGGDSMGGHGGFRTSSPPPGRAKRGRRQRRPAARVASLGTGGGQKPGFRGKSFASSSSRPPSLGSPRPQILTADRGRREVRPPPWPSPPASWRRSRSEGRAGPGLRERGGREGRGGSRRPRLVPGSAPAHAGWCGAGPGASPSAIPAARTRLEESVPPWKRGLLPRRWLGRQRTPAQPKPEEEEEAAAAAAAAATAAAAAATAASFSAALGSGRSSGVAGPRAGGGGKQTDVGGRGRGWAAGLAKPPPCAPP